MLYIVYKEDLILINLPYKIEYFNHLWIIFYNHIFNNVVLNYYLITYHKILIVMEKKHNYILISLIDLIYVLI
jgi:hypothetical protein